MTNPDEPLHRNDKMPQRIVVDKWVFELVPFFDHENQRWLLALEYVGEAV